MQQLDFKDKKKALSVLASGDHVFNLIYYGILNIDTFDTNRLTEYYALGLKRAALLAFTYEEYLLFNQKLICLCLSYITIEPATATFNDSALPIIGMYILDVALSKLSEIPFASLPKIIPHLHL